MHDSRVVTTTSAPAGVTFDLSNLDLSSLLGSYEARRLIATGLGASSQDLQSLAKQVVSAASSAPAGAQSAVQAILSRSTGFNTPGFGTIKELCDKLSGGFSPPSNLVDSDMAVLQSALNDLNAAAQGVAPAAAPVVAQGTAGQVHTIEQVVALIAQMKALLANVPSSLTTQVNAILNRQTSYPANTINGIMSYYASARGSAYTDRDYAALAQAVSDVQAILTNGGASVPLPAPSVGIASPSDLVALAPGGSTPNGLALSPQALATLNSLTPPAGAFTGGSPYPPTAGNFPASAGGGGFLNGTTTIPYVGDVPNVVLAGVALVLALALSRRSSGPEVVYRERAAA